MKFNPDAIDLCRQYVNDEILELRESDLITIEKEDYRKAIHLLYKHTKKEYARWWEQHYENFESITEEYTHIFSAYSFVSRLKEDLTFRKRDEARRSINADLENNFKMTSIRKIHFLILNCHKLKNLKRETASAFSFSTLDEFLTRYDEEED